MHGNCAYELIGFGAVDCHLPYEFIWFGAMDDHLPYEFTGLGTMNRVVFHMNPKGLGPWIATN